MKLIPRRTSAAFTRTELLFVVVTSICLFILATMLMPALGKAKAKSGLSRCWRNQKEIGTAFRVFASDNGDLYPLQALANPYIYQTSFSSNAPGVVASTNAQAWQVFQAMWNELQTPKVLLCPNDLVRKSNERVINFNGLAGETNVVTLNSLGHPDNQNRAVSYAPQATATEMNPLGVGNLDNNINFATEKTFGKTKAAASGSRFSITSPEQARRLYWVKGRNSEPPHGPGNLTYADGSVHQGDATVLQQALLNAGAAYGWGTATAPGPGASVFLMP